MQTSVEDRFPDSGEEESSSQDSADSNNFPTRSSFKGINCHGWITTCPSPSRTQIDKLKHTTEGPIIAAKIIQNKVDAFAGFTDEDILKKVIASIPTIAQEGI